ncbi:FUSC family protein [Nocardioides sp. zg-1228]|uniref:FUSC family protein n=1 Tax=Nocardioides sp. zg-1228 TaxID=2763008 RepID=UPI0016431C88|nr:FUSC family protein [Nocardioides sp. zg-1228]MBC2933073.1 FUSC family protein [Nocardioides sp. zg-1228]QSF56737.1 FUSC family protein [Nocardioides sp. zg-1228]
METVWLVLGAAVLAATLADVFLTVLNYDEAGFLSGPVARGQWHLLRRVTRRLPRRWRPYALRQVTGLQVVIGILVWVFGVILGFGLIYRGLMTPTSFSVSGRGSSLDFFDAMYFSAAQLSTVGGSALTAETDVLRFLSITETLSGVVLISLILTFLLGVYSVISDLNALCRHFFTAERGAGSPVDSLAPFFQGGQQSGLDGHLDGIAESFASYTDGLRLHHAAYYFQSGRDHFALPYAVRMLGGTIGALRWGLPSGHPASTLPGLVPLTFQFLEFGEQLEQSVHLGERPVPEVVGFETFRAQALGEQAPADQWVPRFVQLETAMARLVGTEPLADLHDSHTRYSRWLPFAYRSEQLTLGVSDDLDYQPVIVGDRPVAALDDTTTVAAQMVLRGQPPPVGDPTAAGARSTLTPLPRWRRFAQRDLAQVDPGYARLRTAMRSVVAAVLAVASLYVLLDAATDRAAIQPAVFGGFVAMTSTGVAVERSQRGQVLTSVLQLVPIGVVVFLGALVSDSTPLTGVLLAVVALVGTWVGHFGARWAAIGRVSFMAYYFALILRLQPSDAPWFLGAAAVGVLWALLVCYVLLPARPRKELREGIEGFTAQLVSAMDTLVDAISWARWSGDVRKRADLELRQLRRAGAFIGGCMTGDEETIGVSPERAAALRLRLFDTELAVKNLASAARDVTGTTLSLELRARLAGRLELLQVHLARTTALATPDAHLRPDLAALPPWTEEEPPQDWPRQARALHAAIDELQRVSEKLRDAVDAALDPEVAYTVPLAEQGEVGADALVAPGARQAAEDAPPAGRSLAPSTRQAIQAAVATGLALAVGELVSSSHQYWAVLAAYQVLGGTDGETLVKGAQRLAGTVGGAAIGFAIALESGSDPAVVLPVLAVAVFASAYYRQVSPALTALWTTMIFAMLYEYLGRLTSLALEERVLETVFGALVALAVAALVLPRHTRTHYHANLAALVEDVDVIVTASLSRLAGDHAISQTAVRQRLLDADRHVRSIATAADPLRRSAGALEPGGVESQLTAAWSLVFHTRQLVGAVEGAITEGVDPGVDPSLDWGALSRATSENVAALTTALSGRLPGAIDDSVGDGADVDAPQRTIDAVLLEVSLVNQTLLALLEAVSPGAVGAAEPAAEPTTA